MRIARIDVFAHEPSFGGGTSTIEDTRGGDVATAAVTQKARMIIRKPLIGQGLLTTRSANARTIPRTPSTRNTKPRAPANPANVLRGPTGATIPPAVGSTPDSAQIHLPP